MDTSLLKPGDHLLYSGSSVWSRFIKIKTWSDYSHIELYVGDGKCFSSRENMGVRFYPFTDEHLTLVLRPNEPFDINAGMKWMHSAVGQKYDYWGLMRFFKLGKQSTDKQFCSEAVLRADRACGFEPFSSDYDADLVPPGFFPASPHLVKI